MLDFCYDIVGIMFDAFQDLLLFCAKLPCQVHHLLNCNANYIRALLPSADVCVNTLVTPDSLKKNHPIVSFVE